MRAEVAVDADARRRIAAMLLSWSEVGVDRVAVHVGLDPDLLLAYLRTARRPVRRHGLGWWVRGTMPADFKRGGTHGLDRAFTRGSP